MGCGASAGRRVVAPGTSVRSGGPGDALKRNSVSAAATPTTVITVQERRSVTAAANAEYTRNRPVRTEHRSRVAAVLPSAFVAGSLAAVFMYP